MKPRYKWFLAVVGVLVAFLVLAASTPVLDAPLHSYKYRQITGLSAVKDLSDNGSRVIPAGAHLAHIQVEAQSLRYRDGHSEGSLTTRTDADTGVITVTDDDHAITNSNTVFVWWSGGVVRSMTVSSVATNAITVDGGTGDDLPAADTAMEIGVDPTATVGMTILAGDGVWYDGPIHRFRAIEAGASAKINLTPYGMKR